MNIIWMVMFSWHSGLSGQVILPVYADSLFSTYYHQRVTHFKSQLQTKDDIIFLGNSITDGAEWSEMFRDSRIKNRGISGDVSAGVINRLDEITGRKPSKVFLLIGTNDFARNITPDSLVKNILIIASYFRQKSPATKLFIQSILPVNEVYAKFSGHTSKQHLIKDVNAKLQRASSEYFYSFLDLSSHFANKSGKLKSELSNDGLHLTGEGYLLWKHLIYPYIFDLQSNPALIPLPQQLRWQEGYFHLYRCKQIVVRSKELQNEAERLQQYFRGIGLTLNLSAAPAIDQPYIELSIEKVNTVVPGDEAYQLEVNPLKVKISANSAHGIFNGIQTLLQLSRDATMIDACEITDWPAFSWRGFMVDVGRNYQSIDLLKQQIEVMSKYKLNIFHFHSTEDIAWRLQIKGYPQLTAPENMLRNKGQYYSESELKDLIAFCKERYITLVPEIDMPGHSAAFTRAMGYNMQSDSGLVAVRNILKEFCTTYDIPYLHIGADEVKITNKDFLPAVTSYIEGFGKRVIGWQPGGNFTSNTIRQLWLEEAGNISPDREIQYIDSRHLYLNHMDPLESVVSIFRRKICNKTAGDKTALGGTICVWHDRAAATEDDILRMNPVYPGMLAFAERIWRGGGHEGWTATIGVPGSAIRDEFVEFENRLLDNKQQFFSGLTFPYAKQSHIEWKLYGPYPNQGDLSKQFEPESRKQEENKGQSAVQASGGTIVLRHWWHPSVKGVIAEPKENTTWYATTKIWSHETTIKDCWIGFNNLSRSYNSDSPLPGTWDNRGSSIWINQQLIKPPAWKRAGNKGNSEIPLIDEGYEYREPIRITLKQGWNDVLVKLPVGNFKGPDWQNPIKWMFTFVLLTNR